MRAPTLAALTALALSPLALSACVPENGPWMYPGSDCLACHSEKGTAPDRVWSVAGTTANLALGAGPAPELAGATVSFVDAAGKTHAMTSNGAGNFYTAESVVFPLSDVTIAREGQPPRVMPMPAQSGSCNACHTAQGLAAPL